MVVKINYNASSSTINKFQLPAQILASGGIPAAVTLDEAEEDEDEELGHAETYAEYMPPKCKRYSVVESSSLSENKLKAFQ